MMNIKKRLKALLNLFIIMRILKLLQVSNIYQIKMLFLLYQKERKY